MRRQKNKKKMDEIQSPKTCGSVFLDQQHPTKKQQEEEEEHEESDKDRQEEEQQQEPQTEKSHVDPSESDPIEIEEVFLFDGDSFYDAQELVEEAQQQEEIQEEECIEQVGSYSYWGMRFDQEQNAPYYFSYTTTEAQWEPPEDMMNWETKEVYLWDADAQWFYFYNIETGESRWLEEISWEQQEQEAQENEEAEKDETDPDAAAAGLAAFYPDESASIATTDELEESMRELFLTEASDLAAVGTTTTNAECDTTGDCNSKYNRNSTESDETSSQQEQILMDSHHSTANKDITTATENSSASQNSSVLC